MIVCNPELLFINSDVQIKNFKTCSACLSVSNVASMSNGGAEKAKIIARFRKNFVLQEKTNHKSFLKKVVLIACYDEIGPFLCRIRGF